MNATINSSYPVRVEYTKQFTSGALQGISTTSKVGFVSEDAAQGFLDALIGEITPCAGSSKYIVTDAKIFFN